MYKRGVLFINLMITLTNQKTDKVLDFKFMEKYRHIDPYSYLPIFQSPDWYLQLHEMLAEFFYSYAGQKMPREWLKKREEIVKMVEELMKANLISLGNAGKPEVSGMPGTSEKVPRHEGKDHDKERKLIDTAIIHHTSTKHNAKLSYIDALCLLRLYSRYYSNKENREHGRPIWSNHIINGKQTFIPYHYIIRRDGTFERCLSDEMIGWHSGNRETNCRSIAICFLDDLENSKPTEQAMATAIQIIKKYNISTDKIFGHREINLKTTCPGKNFFEWKFQLLNGIQEHQ